MCVKSLEKFIKRIETVSVSSKPTEEKAIKTTQSTHTRKKGRKQKKIKA